MNIYSFKTTNNTVQDLVNNLVFGINMNMKDCYKIKNLFIIGDTDANLVLYWNTKYTVLSKTFSIFCEL